MVTSVNTTMYRDSRRRNEPELARMLAMDMGRELGLIAVAAAGVTVPVVTVPLFLSSELTLETVPSPPSSSLSSMASLASKLLGEVLRLVLLRDVEFRSNMSLLLLLSELLVLLSVPALLTLSCAACVWPRPTRR